ncbi:site-specific DNA-methyltransferase [Terrimesophilobacter mesophilus]|uniref:Methyltransferase n=1 Tax=Terrimesophilobacter mesophilus TaxID=433647 RepID=A0A4R8VD77_9MICO|nr:site-specific DNA-methyltransferase [Terrimesophilobacter mesophilus]TFB80426.1 site-specific DNA-methyltransferase [Terrimesophilobacter mesophilus]
MPSRDNENHSGEATRLSGPSASPIAESHETWTVHQGDARNTDAFLAKIAQSTKGVSEPFLTTSITSPPYANVVDYGVPGQIGFSQSYDDYLEECHLIFASLYKWTNDDGSMWLVADSVTQSPGPGRPSRLRPLPFDLGRMAESAGWTLRDVIVWRKDRTRPWSNRGRLRNGFEYVLYFVKSDKYKYRIDRLRDFSGLKSWWVRYPERHNPWGLAPDNVWEIPIPLQGSWATTQLRHACPFPSALVERILLLSTDEGDVVFDPFAGSGMVAAVSEASKRLALGIELNPTFVKAYQQHIRPETLIDREVGTPEIATITTELLLSLRVLKFPRELLRQILRGGIRRNEIAGVVVSAAPFDLTPRSSSYASISCELWLADSVSEVRGEEILRLAELVSAVPPLSKFTLDCIVKVTSLADGSARHADEVFSVYRKGRTWSEFDRHGGEWVPYLEKFSADSLPPILSALTVQQALEIE